MFKSAGETTPGAVSGSAEQQNGAKRTRMRRDMAAVLMFLVVAGLFSATFRVAVVKGRSMLPTYHDDEMVLVSRVATRLQPLQAGDVVLVKHGNDTLIKRVAYLPNQVVPEDEAFAFAHVADLFDVAPDSGPNALRVPPGFLVVLGDNRAVSDDSRAFGPVPIEDVLGEVVGAPGPPGPAL